jgi:MFS family permease
MELMRRPYATERAYKLFGLLLGTLPPAAIFYMLFFDREIGRAEAFSALLVLCFLMNVICAFVGGALGARLGRCMDKLERRAWPVTIFASALLGICWAAATGAAGGFIYFGIGALFGAAFAIPVGAFGFALFTMLHRLMARGGMIDARHFWPLACGIASVISAFILGLR